MPSIFLILILRYYTTKVKIIQAYLYLPKVHNMRLRRCGFLSINTMIPAKCQLSQVTHTPPP